MRKAIASTITDIPIENLSMIPLCFVKEIHLSFPRRHMRLSPVCGSREPVQLEQGRQQTEREVNIMAPRRPKDIEAELKALQEKARQLRGKQKLQLGELLIATGVADALDPDALAGLLLHGMEQAKIDLKVVEGWRYRGKAFFRRERAAAGNDSTPAAAPEGRTVPTEAGAAAE